MDIREILGISEMYEFIRYLKDIIFDKQRREEYFNKIIEDIDLRTDFIRDVFQAEIVFVTYFMSFRRHRQRYLMNAQELEALQYLILQMV